MWGASKFVDTKTINIKMIWQKIRIKRALKAKMRN